MLRDIADAFDEQPKEGKNSCECCWLADQLEKDYETLKRSGWIRLILRGHKEDLLEALPFQSLLVKVLSPFKNQAFKGVFRR